MTQEANKPTIMMICFKAIQVFLIFTPQNCKQTRPVTSLNMTRKIKRGMIKKEWLVQERSYLMGAHRWEATVWKARSIFDMTFLGNENQTIRYEILNEPIFYKTRIYWWAKRRSTSWNTRAQQTKPLARIAIFSYLFRAVAIETTMSRRYFESFSLLIRQNVPAEIHFLTSNQSRETTNQN